MIVASFGDFVLPPPRRIGDDSRDIVQLYDWLRDLHSGANAAFTSVAQAGAGSEVRRTFWRNRAALLDPRAIVHKTPPFYDIVPDGETWFLLNAFYLDARLRTGSLAANSAGAFAHYEHRNPHYENALPIGPGTQIAQFVHYGFTETTGLAVYCRPSLVWAIDDRYDKDPEGLYYERIARLNLLEVRKTWATIAEGSAADSLAVESLDWTGSDSAYGILRHTSTADAAWVLFQGTMEDDASVLNMALMDEINDHHSHRFGWPTIFPFTRKRPGVRGFDSILLKGGNLPGNNVDLTGADVPNRWGHGVVTWSALPSDW